VIDLTFHDYERTIVDAWRRLPCTRGRTSSRDHALLRSMHARGIPAQLILAAFRLAALRRSPDLPPVRSIAYFLPVIDELALADPSYIDYLIAHP